MRCFASLSLFVLLLAACGDATVMKGSVGWDSREALLKITGEGAYTLEMNNNGEVPVEYQAGDLEPVKAFVPGDSRRIEGAGGRTLRFVNGSGKEALITYVFRCDGNASVSALVP